MFKKTEKINLQRLEEIKKCTNIPVYDETQIDDINWLKKFKTQLKNYNTIVTYKQKGETGRFYGNGLQMFPRDIRKYCSGEFYIDIDIVNCHLVIIENVIINNNIKVPNFLKEYNLDRNKTIKKYKFTDKLDLIKIINMEKCYSKYTEIQEFHKVLYNDVFLIFQKMYQKIKIDETKTSNKLGCLMSMYLQNIENNILIIMINKCKEMNISIDVLIFDGFMISRELYFPELLGLLENEIYKKINYKVKLVEKSMETDWKPLLISKNDIKDEYNNYIENNYDDKVDNIDISDSLIKSNINKIIYKQLIDCKCVNPNYIYNIDKYGFCMKCDKCNSQFPKDNILISNKYKTLNNYFNITINNNIITNTEDIIDIDVDDIIDVLDDKELNKLLIDIIDINNTENLLNIIKYCSNKDGCNYKCVGKIENKNTWYTWNTIWIKEETPNMAKEYKIMQDNLIKLNKITKNKNIKSIIKTIRKESGNMITRNNVNSMWALMYKDESFEDLIDSNPYLIGFNNGVYDLKNMTFRQQQKEDYVTMTVGYNYDNNGNNKRQDVINFFETIIPNADNRKFLLKTLASCLVGINKEERLSIFTGSTRNSKGVLTEIMKKTLGEYVGTTSGAFIQGDRPDSGSPQPDLLNFRKKRVVILNEIDEKRSLNTQFVKNLVGNDTINCRALYSNRNIEFKAQFKMILNCNERPPLDSNKIDIWSKIYLLIFPITFVDTEKEIINDTYKLKDNNLKEKIQEWNVDMMNLLIEYYQLYLDEGLEYTDDIKKSIFQEKKLNDPIGEFIDEYLERKENDKIKVTDVINLYISVNKLYLKPKERTSLKLLFNKKLGEMKDIKSKGREYWLHWSIKNINLDEDL